MIRQVNYQINSKQFILLIHGIQVGVGQLSLPRELAEAGGTSSWMALFIGWAASVVASLCIVQVMKRTPDGTLIDLLAKYFGQWAGKVGAVCLILYFTLCLTAITMSAGIMISGWLLPRTQLYVLIALFAVPTYMIVKNGVRVLGRYAELVFLMFLPMALFLLVPLRESHLLHLFPLFKDGFQPILSAVGTTVFSFTGYEVAFIVYPFLRKKEFASIGIVIANTLSLLVFLLITLVCFLYFSPDEITQYSQPTLSLLKVIEFRFMERFDILFLSFYLFMISTTWMPQLFCVVYSASRLFGTRDIRMPLAVMLVLLIAYAFLIDPSFDSNEKLIGLMQQLTVVFAYVLPLGLFVYVRMHDRFTGRNGK
ncbi:MAG: spore gernimation protein [Paenibacillus sp.]|jgi:spore germination protein (amino acid permease)|nr:spore gernimation protein [Paenibacillus sp.]